jgi:hypothetical protein
VRVIWAPLGKKAFGGMAFAIMFVRTIVFHHRFGHQRNHGTPVRMDDGRAQHLVIRRDRPVAMDLSHTRCPVNSLGGNIPRAIERQQVAVSEKHHRFERFTALKLAKHALEHRTYRCWGDGIEDLAPVRVARDPIHTVDGVQIARYPFLVKGESSGRCEGTQGERRQERIRGGNDADEADGQSPLREGERVTGPSRT